MRTVERSAARRVGSFLAGNVVLVAARTRLSAKRTLRAHCGAVARDARLFPPGVDDPILEGDRATIEVSSREVFAPVPRLELEFTFDDTGQIARVEQRPLERATPLVTETVPNFVKR